MLPHGRLFPTFILQTFSTLLLDKESSSGAYAILEIFSKYFKVFSINFFNWLYFLEQFWVHSKTEQGVERVLIHPLPWHMHSFLHDQLILHPGDTSVSVYELMLTHHCHLRSISYIRVHSRCCTFCGFGQYIHHCSVTQKTSLPWKPSLLSWFILPSPLPLVTIHLFIVSVVLCVPECHIVGIM